MENKYLKGKLSIMAVSINDNLYRLEDGSYLFVQSLCDDPDDFEYGYYHFDSEKKLTDGGVFNCDASSEEEVIKEVLRWRDLSPETIFELIEECANLEDLGFTGF